MVTMKINFKFQMMSKSLSLFSVIIIFMLFISSCGNSNSANDAGKTDKAIDSTKKSKEADKKVNSEKESSSEESSNELSETNTTEKNVTLTVKETLAKAKKDGNSVFVVVTGTGDTELDKALAMAGKANNSVKKSIVVKMDRDDKNNATLVTEYGIAGAPLPILLVISPKGVLAGGYLLKDATADILVKSIPSPKQDEVLLALNNKKSIFVVAAKSTFTDKAKAIENCKSAVTLNGNKSQLVEVDISDTKEKTFIELLKINTATASTATVVVNSKGQITGTFYEPKDAASLVTLANKAVSGCGSGCAKPCK